MGRTNNMHLGPATDDEKVLSRLIVNVECCRINFLMVLIEHKKRVSLKLRDKLGV